MFNDDAEIVRVTCAFCCDRLFAEGPHLDEHDAEKEKEDYEDI